MHYKTTTAQSFPFVHAIARWRILE